VSEIIGSAAQNIETHAAAGVENFLSAGSGRLSPWWAWDC